MRVVIVGAGIGGLTAAIALRQAGIDVHVYEQARVLREVGAGLSLGPNAVKVLRRLGLDDALRPLIVVPRSLDFLEWQNGLVLTSVALGEAAEARWGASLYHIHRADLHDALRAALHDAHITLGARCVRVEQHGAEVTVTFDDGRSVTGDIVIGADGIHSVVREYVAGPDRPVWSHQVSWRGLAPASVAQALGMVPRQYSYWGPRKQFVAYYVSAGAHMNWVGHSQSDDDRQEESWSARGAVEEALRLFAGWNPQVRSIIAGTESIFRWALLDRLPLETWTRGRVTLLGDAAHAMLPFLGQGASQSIEDALVLTRCLAAHLDEPELGIAAYVARRRERTTAVQTAARDTGRLVQETDEAMVAKRNAQMRTNPAGDLARYDWIWGYDAESVSPDA